MRERACVCHPGWGPATQSQEERYYFSFLPCLFCDICCLLLCTCNTIVAVIYFRGSCERRVCMYVNTSGVVSGGLSLLPDSQSVFTPPLRSVLLFRGLFFTSRGCMAIRNSPAVAYFGGVFFPVVCLFFVYHFMPLQGPNVNVYVVLR